MKKEASKGKKNITREDFKRFYRTGSVDIDPTDYDDFSRAALGGVRYQKGSPETAFSRMEEKLGLPASTGKSVSLRFMLTAAAGVLILVSVGYLAFFRGASLSGEAIYKTHFAAISYLDDDLERGTRAEGMPTNNLKEQAIRAYSNEDYGQAEALFQLYLREAPSRDPVARFYYGITLLEQKRLNAAISIFNETKRNPPIPALQRPASFYLALAYIRQDKPGLAIPVLQSLTDQEDRYGRAAKQIISASGL